jgi:ATP-binding cassette subfamily B protein
VLKDISFIINKGDKIAILGKNGAGKATIIKLLLRLYDPDEGEILINDINIKKYNTHYLCSSIKTLFQDITLGSKINEQIIEKALKEVELYDKITHLEDGVNTPITSQLYKNGIELSGGETQKVAISRVFATNTSFFVLDEPTSSLDPYAEYSLYNNLLQRSKNESTFIVISHRLTLTHKMSKIIVIDKGSIIECGTHKELMELGGVYSDMYKIQSEKYSDVFYT